MTSVVSGVSVRRRINELQTALDRPAPSVSPSRARAVTPNKDEESDVFHDAQEDAPGGSNQGESSRRGPGLHKDETSGRVSPTTPTKESTAMSSLLTSSSRKDPHILSTASPRPTDLTLGPAIDALAHPAEEDRYSVSTASTPDLDRFSTVQLKTPTTSEGPEDTFDVLPNLELTRNASNGVMSKLNDNELDVGTSRVGLGFDEAPGLNRRSIGDDLAIRTDLEVQREEMRTPVAGVNGHIRNQAASHDAQQGVSPSPKALAEGVDLLLARLDKTKDDPMAARRSMEGRERLKEDFERLQISPTSTAFPKSPLRRVGTQRETPEEKIDWEFWGEVIANYEHVARTKSEKLASAIQKGVPSTLRGMVWQLMSASKDAELERVYAALLKESSPHEKPIMRDLGRTFPQHSFFMDGQGIGQENLFNVLKAYSLYDTEVGYCQGLAFIGAALLLNMPDEEAFCVLVRLMYSYGSRDMYLPEMPGLQLRLFQFDRLVEELLPVLHVHFLRQGIKSSMFCSQWFLTMFSYRFPLDLVFRIFDSVFGHGIEAIFGFSMVLLIKNEEKLLKLKFDQILDYMKGELFDIYKVAPEDGDITDRSSDGTAQYDADQYVEDAFSVRITPFMLDNYANEWNELRRVQNAHALELETLKNSNRSLTNQVRELESSLSALNAEHCEVLNQLVMAKLEREEVESELVRYKMMYAEVMHDKEDSMSTHRKSSPSASAASRGSSISSLSISFPSFSRS